MAASVLAGLAAADAMADLVDSTELLDVDVDQLAGALSLVAIRRFGRLEPAALPKADPQEHGRDGRKCHPEYLSDLRRGKPQPAKCRDRDDTRLRRATRHAMRRRGAVEQPELALCAVASYPL
jgi:hypothetical protein